MDAIYVGCPLCHAQVGQECLWGVAKGKYHSHRVNQARLGPHWINTEHGLAHGEACTDSEGALKGICLKCGQTIARLRAIPALLAANPKS